ncbi:solute carrier family 12 member 9-like [Conger conger]|uniref:solute carrier family 12 member 9-like n=1 Tax=Conger conger TaxID=82655 RepID=UPI002A5A17DD|nr:solute carrier family 12 member 9-like [Conger conger]
MLDVRKEHVKFWRPQVLLMVANPRSSCQLITFINQLKKSGLFVLGHMQLGVLDALPSDPIKPQYTFWLSLVDKLGVKAFVDLTLSPSVRQGTQHLLRITGLGVLLGRPRLDGEGGDPVRPAGETANPGLHKDRAVGRCGEASQRGEGAIGLHAGGDAHDGGDPPSNAPESFLSGVNGLLLEHSAQAAVRFLYLPSPPADSSQSQQYLAQLEAVTRDLGPTLLIHGLTKVTCTEL